MSRTCVTRTTILACLLLGAAGAGCGGTSSGVDQDGGSGGSAATGSGGSTVKGTGGTTVKGTGGTTATGSGGTTATGSGGTTATGSGGTTATGSGGTTATGSGGTTATGTGGARGTGGASGTGGSDGGLASCMPGVSCSDGQSCTTTMGCANNRERACFCDPNGVLACETCQAPDAGTTTDAGTANACPSGVMNGMACSTQGMFCTATCTGGQAQTCFCTARGGRQDGGTTTWTCLSMCTVP